MNCYLHGFFLEQAVECPGCLRDSHTRRQLLGMQNVTLYSQTAIKQETELERLVRVANEGLAAAHTLWLDHSDQLEEREGAGWHRMAGWGSIFNTQFRIKPKHRPLPEPIYVGPLSGGHEFGVRSNAGWKVELSEDRKTVNVGCQEFTAVWLRIGLSGLCKQGVTHSDGTVPLVATREGVQYSGHVLSWRDADRLLAYLEEGLSLSTAPGVKE